MTRHTPTRYNAPAKAPASGSTYEFLFTGIAIGDAETKMLPWVPPVPIRPNMDPLVSAYFRRTNPERERVEQELVKPFLDGLAKTSIASAELVPPYSEPVRTLVDAFLAGQRAILLRHFPDWDVTETRTLDDSVYHRELAVRTIMAAVFMLKPAGAEPSPQQVCSYLNAGHGSEETALNRHSIRSAWRTFRQQLRGHGNLRLHQLTDDVARVRALEALRERARTDERFRRLRGEDLAYAIHQDFDLNESVWRAKRRLLAAGRAAQMVA